MRIWKREPTLDAVNQLLAGTMCEHIGMAISEIGPDYVAGTLPVDARTCQHMGIIHGGASVVLAETLGSLASMLCCAEGFHVVGLEINANHISAGKPPYVSGIARPLHIGSSTMVWEIRISNNDGKLVCVSRLTCAVLQNR
ncbi:MAG: hotdog fold thioesterase [Pseudomonadales bacterium]|jgi:1,4-dihydroxy-2-naphthoyl-CoA hydrolase|nr:hotdog fold thioesterase [Pseudomonadales bacterium]